MRVAIALIVTWVVAGCGEAGGRASSMVVRDSLGIEIVEYDLSPDAPRYELAAAPVVNLASSEEFFNRTGTFDRDEHGRFLVVDNSGTARVFDVNGQLLARLGRLGDGPAELGRARFAWWEPGGAVTIYDEFRAGLLRFDSAFQFVDRRSLPYNFGWFAGRLDGGVVVIARSPQQEFALGYSRATMFVHVVQPTGDTLTWQDPIPGKGATSVDPRGSFPACPYGQDPLLAVADSLFVGEVEGDRPALGFFTGEGDLVRILRRPGPPRPPPTPDQLAFATAEFRYHTSEAVARDRIDYEQCDFVTTAEVGRIQIEDTGRIWMAREVTFPAWEARTWDVLEPDGHHIATVDVPPHFRVMAVKGGFILGILTTELGVELPLVFHSPLADS